MSYNLEDGYNINNYQIENDSKYSISNNKILKASDIEEEEPKNLEEEISNSQNMSLVNNNNIINTSHSNHTNNTAQPIYNFYNPIDYDPHNILLDNNEYYPIEKNINKSFHQNEKTPSQKNKNDNYYRNNSSKGKFSSSKTPSSNKIISTKSNNKSIEDSNKENYINKMKRAYTPNYRKNLYDKEKDYNNKRTKSKERYERMKKDLETKFIKEHPFQPQIHTITNINRDETKDERLARLSKPKSIQITERMKQKEFNEEEKFREENNNYPNNINKKINPQTVSNRLYKLHEQIKENKEKLKREFEDSKLKECSFSPEINEKSKKIKYDEPLYKRCTDFEKAKNENLSRIRQNIEKEENEQKKPKISEKSKELALQSRAYNNSEFSNEDIYTRLYKENIKNEKHNYRNKEMEECTFIPQCNNLGTYYTNDEIYQNYGNIDDFLERQKIYDEIKKDRLEKKLNKNQERESCSFKPKINLTSDILMKTNIERANENQIDKYERLYNDAQKYKEKKEQLENFYNAQYDYKPKINELSKFIGRETNINQLNQSNISKNSSKNKLLSSMSKNNKTTYSEQECTFKPKINSNKKYNHIQSNYKNDDGMLERINEEVRNKTEKVKDLQNILEKKDDEECLFNPEINKEIPNFDNNKPMYMKGMARYLEQMEKARQAKRDKEQREKEVFITGENWSKNNLITVPKPFKLSYQNNNKIEEIKKQREIQHMKECTFKPVTNESKNREIIKQLLKD